jgi:hypothetical protein
MIGMLVCDIILYLFLAWYIDSVNSGGTKQPWNFFCRRTYWGTQSRTGENTNGTDEESLEEYKTNDRDFEHVDELGNPAVIVNRLRKSFEINNQTFVAVEGFKLDIYENQLLALLGNFKY